MAGFALGVLLPARVPADGEYLSDLLPGMLVGGFGLGLAIMSTPAITPTEDLVAGGTAQPQALTEGFQLALHSGVGLAVLGALAVLLLVRSPRRAEDPVGVVAAEAAPEG